MKVEIWSDVICPWCGLGQRRLEQALARFAHADQVEVIHRSFQLDPDAPTTPMPVREMLGRKYGASPEELQPTFARIEQMAQDAGLSPYVVGDNVVGNTELAHEWLALASEKGFEEAAWKRLYRAYFGEKRSIFDEASLVALAPEVGLDPEETRAALRDGRYRERVHADARQAQALGARGVPFVVIDRRFGVAGAQPLEVFERALSQAWDARAEPT